MTNNAYVMRFGEVVVVENNEKEYNEASANRIKVVLYGEENIPKEKLPWCFPLLPKTFQSIPKKGECVLVITTQLNVKESDRFYIGPIISQPQYMEDCQNYSGRGPATSLFKNGNKSYQLPKIDNYDETQGAFPNPEDIALIGRTTEDITIKDGVIDLRCGIRSKAYGNETLKGNVILNTNSPSYIQLKFKQNMTTKNRQEANSMINLVADKINLISHQDHNLSPTELVDSKELIKEDELDNIMSKLHELPYGDILVEYLKIMQNAVLYHGHNFGPAEPPIRDMYITSLNNVDFDKTLSPNVRIS